ncbi:hypothetical protein BDAP_000540 [Binucleata daphniae]
MEDIMKHLMHAALMFVFTITFSYAYKIFHKSKISSYLKCFAGGIILSTMIFHIVPDLYETKNIIGPFFAGISFLVLFWIDKLYLQVQGEHDSLPDNVTLRKATIFVIALSVHSFLEGIGLPAKNSSQVFYYLIGLFGHKWIEAFALGVSIAAAPFTQRTAFFLTFLYSSLTPLGIITGLIALKSNVNDNVKNIIELVLTGLSSGSFFYIGFVEMLNSEFHHHHHYKKEKSKTDRNKLTAITTGFFIMTVLFCVIERIEQHFQGIK